MTTILADARKSVMVSESKTTAPDGSWFPSTKIARIADALVGVAGDASAGDAWLDWLRDGRQGKPPKGDVTVLILRKGVCTLVDTTNGRDVIVERGFHAIGSGAAAALGALHAGATPAQAVKIACMVDASSGGRIRTVAL